MRLSRRSEYGLRALTDLVRHDGEGRSRSPRWPSANRLPVKFLEQIMATLKHAGIVRTTLGAHGGYAMAAQPAAVSIGRVIRLLDGALAPLRLRLAALLRAVLLPGRGDLRAARRDDRRPRRDARDPRQRDAGRPGRRDRAAPRSTRAAATPTRSRAGARSRLSRAQSRSRLRSAALTRSSSVLADADVRQRGPRRLARLGRASSRAPGAPRRPRPRRAAPDRRPARRPRHAGRGHLLLELEDDPLGELLADPRDRRRGPPGPGA